MGRFDAPPDPAQQTVVRIEDALAGLAEEMRTLSLPVPVVEPTTPPTVDVSVPTEGLVEAIVRALHEAVAALPEPPTPQVNLEGITAEADLGPLLEAAQQQRSVMEALNEKLANITAGPRSHFDGRLRDNDGLISTSNPLAVGGNDLADIKRGVTDFETRLDYDVRTDSNPVYLGRALDGTSVTETWTIQKFTYDGSDRVTQIQVTEGRWDARTTLF